MSWTKNSEEEQLTMFSLKDPYFLAMCLVLPIVIGVISNHYYQQMNAGDEANSGENNTGFEFPMVKYHAPIIRQPDPETGDWLPVPPQPSENE